MANCVKWSTQELEILKAMIAAGKRTPDISKVLKTRTEEAINNKASSMGLSLAGPVEIDMEEFNRLMEGCLGS